MTKKKLADPLGYKKQEMQSLSKDLMWSEKFCKRCGICIRICPKNNLDLEKNKMIDKGQCILCGLCEKNCPDFAIELLRSKK